MSMATKSIFTDILVFPPPRTHGVADEHGDKVNQFILAHPRPHKLHPLLDGVEKPIPLERMGHDSHFSEPRWRAWRSHRIHLDVDDRIGHLPLLPFSHVSLRMTHSCRLCQFFRAFCSLVAYPVGSREGLCSARETRGDPVGERHEQ